MEQSLCDVPRFSFNDLHLSKKGFEQFPGLDSIAEIHILSHMIIVTMGVSIPTSHRTHETRLV